MLLFSMTTPILVMLSLIWATFSLKCYYCDDHTPDRCESTDPSDLSKMDCDIDAVACWQVSNEEKTKAQTKICGTQELLDWTNVGLNECTTVDGMKILAIIRAAKKQQQQQPNKNKWNTKYQVRQFNLDLDSANSTDDNTEEAVGRLAAHGYKTYEVCTCDRDLCNQAGPRPKVISTSNFMVWAWCSVASHLVLLMHGF